MSIDLSKIKEDIDVIKPFIERTLQRLQEKHPEIEITTDNVSILIEIDVPESLHDTIGAASLRIRRMLRDMDKEGVVI